MKKMEEKHEVVISGISGSFPECSSIEELEEKLFGKVNMVQENNSRWTPGELDVPPHIGRLKNISSMDSTFFGVPGKLSEALDPVAYMCMQAAFEAICDAGVNPSEVNGSKMAVYMTSMSSDSEYASINSNLQNSNTALLGIAKCFISNRISSFLNVSGPSIMIECAYSGGLYALNLAYKLIASGRVNAALIGGCNILFKPQVSEQFKGMSKLTNSNKTKSFSADADGFNRSEGCIVLFLQRAEFAKRSYGTIKNVLCYNAGSRRNNFPEFCSDSYVELLKSAYSSCGIDPSLVSYVEADGTAIRRVDALELNSLAEVMCGTKRKTPLLVGSVKSNLGHFEGASSLISIAKAIIALKCSRIPPNLHFTAPNPDVPALFNGKMKVVTDSTPLTGDVVGVNVVDLSGCYGHVIIQQNSKAKSQSVDLDTNIPILLNISGRSETKLENVISKLTNDPPQIGQINLIHHLFAKDFYKHLCRGYTIINKEGKSFQDIMPYQGGAKRPIWFVFSGMGSQWPGMGSELLKIPKFANSIKKCQNVLSPLGIDIIDIITNLNKTVFDSILNCFVGIAAIQIGLVDLLNALGIKYDGLIGHSVGEVGCAYADGCFTAEQTILSAYYRGRASIETKMVKGMMAAVGLGYNQLKDKLPPSIEIACHNSKDSCTISGPKEDVENFMEELKSKGIFGKLVNVANTAYHSKHVAPVAPKLLAYLRKVIPKPKERSKAWVSTSVAEEEWDTDLAKLSSPEYHTNNLLKPVRFEEASVHIPSDAICIEIAPHGLLQAILRRSLGQNCTNIPLTNRVQDSGVVFFLKALGRMYLNGIDMDLSQIYPPAELPVPRGTPYISSVVTWSSSNVPTEMLKEKAKCSYEDVILDLACDEENIYNEFKIHDETVLSTAKYLEIILSTFRKMKQNVLSTTDSIIFHKINIHRHLKLKPKCSWNLYTQINPATGKFEILEEEVNSSNILISGVVSYCSSSEEVDFYKNFEIIQTIYKEDIYNYFCEIGLHYGESFKKINFIEYHSTGFRASVHWENKLVILLEAIFGVMSFYNSIKHNEPHCVHRVLKMELGPSLLSLRNNEDIEFWYDFRTRILTGSGIKITHIQTEPYIIKPGVLVSYEKELFVPYGNSLIYSECQNISIIYQLLKENGFAALRQFNTSSIIELFGTTSGYLQEYLAGLKEIMNKDIATHTLNNIHPCNMKVNNQSVLVVADIFNREKAIEILKSVDQGFLLTDFEPNQTLLQHLDFILSLEKGSHIAEGLMLFKKKVNDTPELIIIHTSNTDWEVKLKESLKTAAKKNVEERIILVTMISTFYDVHNILSRFNYINEENIRFLFLDKSAPDFNLAFSFYKEWLKTDMKVNIFSENNWGTLRRIQQLPNTRTKNQYDQLPLSNITCDNISISCVGLNLPGVTGTTKKEKNLEICDYSGCTYNGIRKCGIGILSGNNTLITDPILSWEFPNNWSHEFAATVPVPYSIAFLTLIVYGRVKFGQRVLITEGYNPVSQAAISVALSVGCQVFSTYSTKEQLDFITSTFPQIRVEHIFCSNHKFEMKLRTIEPKGMDVILNTLNGKYFQQCLKCLSFRGQFFNMGIETMEAHISIGMYVFLEEIKFIGINGGHLLGLSNSLKVELNKAVADGIKTNVVKPLNFSRFSCLGTKQEALIELKSSHNRSNFTRLVTSFNEDEKLENSSINLKRQTNSCLLLVESDYRFSLSVLKWLLIHGVKHITVCLTQEIPSIYFLRFNAIISKFKKNSTELSWHQLRNDISIIERVCKQAMPIDTIFAVPSETSGILLQLNDILTKYSPNAPLVLFGNFHPAVCNQRKNQKCHTFCFNFDQLSNYDNVFNGFEEMLINRDEYVSVICFKEQGNHNESRTVRSESLEILPSNCEELVSLGSEQSDECFFEEVTTRSCHYSTCKELLPVFVIPGVKTKQLNALISKLMHPAFKLKMPVNLSSYKHIAGVILENLLKFEINFYTLISSDLGGALTLEVARKLEICGKKVCIVLLEGSPDIIKGQLNKIKLSDDVDILNRYFNISQKELRKMDMNETWEEKINKVFELKTYSERVREKLKIGIDILRNRLKLIDAFNTLENKTTGITHLITQKEQLIANKGNLQKHCCGKIIVHLVNEASYNNIFYNDKVISLVNDNILYSNRDVADESAYFQVKLQITDMKFNTPGLERI